MAAAALLSERSAKLFVFFCLTKNCDNNHKPHENDEGKNPLQEEGNSFFRISLCSSNPFPNRVPAAMQSISNDGEHF